MTSHSFKFDLEFEHRLKWEVYFVLGICAGSRCFRRTVFSGESKSRVTEVNTTPIRLDFFISLNWCDQHGFSDLQTISKNSFFYENSSRFFLHLMYIFRLNANNIKKHFYIKNIKNVFK